MEKVSITIIGAGVVGLAIAAELGERYDNVVLLLLNMLNLSYGL